MHDEVISHDNAISQLFYEYKKISKESVTDIFLASLSTNESGWRATLGVYSIMQTFPEHSYIERDTSSGIHNTNPCKICSSFRNSYADFKRFADNLRLSSDDFMHNIYSYLFILWNFNNRMPCNIKPRTEDLDIFLSMMEFIKSEKECKNPSELHKRLIKSKILKSFNGAQIRSLIEILGYCGILTSEKRKGPLYEYINIVSSSRKSSRSDWSYPVDFWTGADGLNEDAYDFWFGGICNK